MASALLDASVMSRFAALVLLLAAGCDGPALGSSSGCASYVTLVVIAR